MPTTSPRPLSEGERTLTSVTAAAVGALGLIGFVISFATVMDAAKPTFGPLAANVRCTSSANWPRLMPRFAPRRSGSRHLRHPSVRP